MNFPGIHFLLASAYLHTENLTEAARALIRHRGSITSCWRNTPCSFPRRN
ncbi:MAG: hypothetical protein MZV63_11155 [Marinilabiliales bacterium]|nr:hypothetical protein [Marinilabiliales bacterium]